MPQGHNGGQRHMGVYGHRGVQRHVGVWACTAVATAGTTISQFKITQVDEMGRRLNSNTPYCYCHCYILLYAPAGEAAAPASYCCTRHCCYSPQSLHRYPSRDALRTNQGPRSKVQGTGYRVQPRVRVQGPGSSPGPGSRVQGSRVQGPGSHSTPDPGNPS